MIASNICWVLPIYKKVVGLIEKRGARRKESMSIQTKTQLPGLLSWLYTPRIMKFPHRQYPIQDTLQCLASLLSGLGTPVILI